MHVQMLLLLLLLALPWSSSIDSIPILSHPNEPFRRGSDRSCSAGFKVYVYNISADLLQLAEQARRNQTFHVCQKCIYEQFALEYVLFDYFTQFCGRTHDPSQADFFYLPIIREIDYRVALQRGNRAPSKIEEALIDAIEKQNTDTWRQVFGVTDEFWRRNKGMDHILVMPAPVTNLRHQTSARGFFHYMIQLHTPIFLNVEYSLSFVREYPVCATAKNIVMPYPTTDPDFFSGRLYLPHYRQQLLDKQSDADKSALQPRDKLVFYHGGNHGSCVFIRSALNEIMRNKQIATQRGDRKREMGFQSAVFCPIPVGDSPGSKRMYDVLNFGCIPVVLSDDLLWAFSTQSTSKAVNYSSSSDNGYRLDPTKFSLHLPQRIVQLSAQEFLSEKNYSDIDFNLGKPLPGTGVSLLSLIEEVAAEETQLLTTAASSKDLIADKTGRRRRSRHLLACDDYEGNMVYSELGQAKRSIKSKNSRERRLAAKKKQRPEGNEKMKSPINVLVRVLQKISLQDISKLQEGVRESAQYYQYYSMDPSLKAIPTAIHMLPTGGAVKQLEMRLQNLKTAGVSRVGSLCQAEKERSKHKYISKYPCEKA